MISRNILWRFAGLYAALAFGLPIAGYALYELAGVDVLNASLVTIPMMLSAMQVGVWMTRSEGGVPKGAEAWKAALLLSAIGAPISLVQTITVVIYDPSMARWVFNIYIGWLFVGFVLLSVLLARLFLGLGERNQRKVEARLNKQKDRAP